MRTKLLAAVFVAAGALGITGGAMILSNADAQTAGGSGSGAPPLGGTHGAGSKASGLPPGLDAPPSASPNPFATPGGLPPGPGAAGGPRMGAGMGVVAGHREWEYKFVDVFAGRKEFEKVITQHGKDGWEFCGSERFAGQNVDLVVVFKRPKGGPTGGGMMGGMGMPGGMGEGRGGGGMPGGGMAGANEFRVFRLEHVAAEDVVQGLRKAFPAAKLRAVAEKTSNSVIVIDADAATMKEVARLIDQLDAKPGTGPRPTPGSRPPAGGGDMGMGAPTGGGSSLGPPSGGSGSAAPPMGGGPARPATVTNVIILKHADAADVAAVLKKVFPQVGEFTADPRTNQLIVRADQETLFEVAALIERLDIDVPKKRAP